MATPEAQKSISPAPDVSQLAQQGMPLDAFAHLLTSREIIDNKRRTAVNLMVEGIKTTQLSPDDETTMLRSFNLLAAGRLELFLGLTKQHRDVIETIGQEVPGLTMEKLAEVWNTTALQDQTPNPEDSIPTEEQPGFLIRMSYVNRIAQAAKEKRMRQFAQAGTIMEAHPLTTWLEATHIRDLKSAKYLLMLEVREFATNPKRLPKKLEKVVENLKDLFVTGYGFKTVEDALRQMDESGLFDDQTEELKQVVATLREYVQLPAENNESAT